MRNLRFTPVLTAAASAVLFSTGAAAVSDASSAEARIEALEQKIKVLERRLEIADEEAAKVKAEAPVVKGDSKGFSITSADKAFQLKLRGFVQSDARFVTDDDGDTFSDTFTLRRVRPVIEGTVWKYYGFRIVPDFGGGQAVLQDAYIDANYTPGFRIRAGKFKSPVGLERLQSGTDIRFVERGLPTNLVGNRDVGIQVFGDLFGGAVGYAAGIFHGAPDGGNVSDRDLTDAKEFAGRLFVSPFASVYGPFQNLGIGIAGSWGETDGADLGQVRSQAQRTFYSYLPGVVADGERYRISPQGWWYWRSFGLLGEYVYSSQEVREPGGTLATLANDSWQILGSWVLTGEENSYKSISPAAPFDPWKGTWGAWELVARYQELDVDEDAFPLFADPAASAAEARSWGIGLNWYLNSNLRLAADYEHTSYDGGAAGGDRPDEDAIFTRVQIAY
jgi:phosphate-selective porin OprO/OprP